MTRRLNRIVSIVAAGFLALAGAMPASAAVILPGSITTSAGTGDTAALTPAGAATFSWAGTAQSSVGFVATEAFRIFFTGYAPVNTGIAISGFALDRASPAPIGRILVPGAATVNCGDGDNGRCNSITGAGGSSTSALKPNAGTALPFIGLAAGQYTLRFFETAGGPASGTATFQISAIPLPAGLPLLLVGIAGLALLGRRRRTA